MASAAPDRWPGADARVRAPGQGLGGCRRACVCAISLHSPGHRTIPGRASGRPAWMSEWLLDTAARSTLPQQPRAPTRLGHRPNAARAGPPGAGGRRAAGPPRRPARGQRPARRHARADSHAPTQVLVAAEQQTSGGAQSGGRLERGNRLEPGASGWGSPWKVPRHPPPATGPSHKRRLDHTRWANQVRTAEVRSGACVEHVHDGGTGCGYLRPPPCARRLRRRRCRRCRRAAAGRRARRRWTHRGCRRRAG